MIKYLFFSDLKDTLKYLRNRTVSCLSSVVKTSVMDLETEDHITWKLLFKKTKQASLKCLF